MARVEGLFLFSGTIGGVTYYKRNGKYYARQAVNRRRKLDKENPRYRKSVENMNIFKTATGLARELQLLIQAGDLRKWPWYKLMGRILKNLHTGATVEEVRELMKIELIK